MVYKAAGELPPLVYEELRLLASQKILQEPPGQTLQATALVHEAYLRLAGPELHPEWPLLCLLQVRVRIMRGEKG